VRRRKSRAGDGFFRGNYMRRGQTLFQGEEAGIEKAAGFSEEIA